MDIGTSEGLRLLCPDALAIDESSAVSVSLVIEEAVRSFLSLDLCLDDSKCLSPCLDDSKCFDEGSISPCSLGSLALRRDEEESSKSSSSCLFDR